MPYMQEISREHKALFVFLLDHSFSMEEPLGGESNTRKMDELALAINGWLQNMVIRATGSEGIKDWMDIAIIGYCTDEESNAVVESPLDGALAGKTLLSITEIGENPTMEQRTQKFYDEDTSEMIETQVEVPVWVRPKAEGGTPMCSALHAVYQIVDEWIKGHPKSFPPIVIHITDGESTEGDPTPYAEPLKELATEDGDVLVFNCHLSMTAADKFLFPHNGEILPDDLARVLFKMSSVLPDSIYERAVKEGFDLQPGARGMAFNADMVSLIKFLDMGTRVASQLR